MSVKLRFRRMGRKQLPIFGLVATDSRSPRDGRFIEDLGRYEPVSEPAVVRLDAERIVYWLGQGAQPSHTVRNLLQKEGVLLRWALTRRGEEADAIETAVAEFKERRAEKASASGKKTRAERRAEALEAERQAAKERAAEIAKEQAEREAELQRQREEAEAAERAAAEEARAQAAADAADSEALTTAADETSAADTDAPEAEAQADAQQEAEAEGGDAAAAEATEADVAEDAPDAAEEQPAVEDETAEAVADETGEEVADQAEAGAEQSDTVEAEPATEAPDVEGTSGDEPAGDTPPSTEATASETEEDAAADAAPASGDSDDLTTIWGVGPKYAGILTDAGMTTFSAVAEASVEDLQAAITDAGSTTAGNEETWPEQARMLAAGDTEGHEAYVESLKNA